MKIRDDFLPYCLPYYDDEEISAITRAIKSNWWSKGPLVGEFEKAFSSYVGSEYALAVNSCTAALHLGLKVHDIGPGDEVITTPMTFCSTANVIVHCGATPVFADVFPDSGLINPAEIEKKITAKTRALMPVHYAGRVCDMDAINEIAQKHNLYVLEDAAHALSATCGDRMIGSINDTAFSFYATKNISTGEGGMLTTKDEETYNRALVMSTQGMNHNAWNRYSSNGTWGYDVVAAGFKYNMTDPAASLGLTQLKKLPKMQSLRLKYATMYGELLKDVPGVTPLPDCTNGRSSWHLYCISIDDNVLSIGRDKFIEMLTGEYNIGTSVHFIPVPLHPYYRENYGTKPGDYPCAEKLYSGIISIPLYPSMSEEDIRYVAEAVGEIASRYAK